jgi:hypothetical protein
MSEETESPTSVSAVVGNIEVNGARPGGAAVRRRRGSLAIRCQSSSNRHIGDAPPVTNYFPDRTG